MFEIRIICDLADTDRVTDTLSQAFTVGTVRQYPARGSERLRLYVTADHHSNTGPRPTAEEAYALAPSIISEIGWTADRARMHLHGRAVDRDYWLRKAALLDRMALDDETARIHTDAAEVAMNAALRLLEIDGEHSEAVTDPRGYVRQAYAHWINHQ